MGKTILPWLLACLFAFLLPAGATAYAATGAEAECIAFSGPEPSLAQINASPDIWQCGEKNWGASGAVAWLRFDAKNWHNMGLPAVLVTRITRFETLSLTAIDRNGSTRTKTYTTDDVTPITAGPAFTAQLPEINSQTQLVIMRIVRPFNVTVLSEARLSDNPSGEGWPRSNTVLLAIIAGLLIAPLILDLNFYMVLRERFVLLHAAMVVAMIVYVTTSGNLISTFVTLPVTLLAILGPLSWALGITASAFFCASFLEPWAISKRMRKIMRAAGYLTLAGPGVLSLQIGFTHAFGNAGYYLTFIPVMGAFVAVLLQAVMRRSRAALFLIAAWLPVILGGTERILRGIGLYSGPASLDHMLFAGLGLEVMIIALGIADRFMAIKRERDQAENRVRVMEGISERDPLTGLLNRRAIEPRFANLYRSGYETLAVIDLDHFKAVNDLHGHNVGDEVLKATAVALAPDEDTLVMRLGGEEFLLLLRGKDSLLRAEQRRQAIPARVASEVGGLDRVVTASMGVVEIPHATMPDALFADLYARADRLLYEAKQAGRNRMMSERQTLFPPRGWGRRKDDKSAPQAA